MKKDDTVFLFHILDAIDQITEYTKGMSENEFLSNSMAHDAVVRQTEIIVRPPEIFQTSFNTSIPNYPGQKMIAIRNKITHEYFNVNYSIVWDTVKDDLPVLQKAIKKILK